MTNFKYEDINAASKYFKKDSFMCTFDLQSGYHHTDIHPAHQQYLAFCWRGQFYGNIIANTRNDMLKAVVIIRNDLINAGFVINNDKSMWELSHKVTWFGFQLDAQKN
jgi:hypothetical protein